MQVQFYERQPKQHLLFTHEECIQCTFNRPTLGHNTPKKRAVTHTNARLAKKDKKYSLLLCLGFFCLLGKPVHPKVCHWVTSAIRRKRLDMQLTCRVCANLLIHFHLLNLIISCQMHLINHWFNAFLFAHFSSFFHALLNLYPSKDMQGFWIKERREMYVTVNQWGSSINE